MSTDRKQRVIAAIIMTVLSVCAEALTVSAANQPGAGVVSYLSVGLTVVSVVTLLRAWQLGGKRGSIQVPSTKAWRWLAFTATAVASCVYAALAVTSHGNLAVTGMLLLLIANLIPMLLFEVNQIRPQSPSMANLPRHE